MPKIVDHNQRRELIAEAAVSVIAEKGFRNSKLLDIADAAGLSTGACGHYFRDKDSLLSAAIERVFARIFLKLDSPSEPLTLEETLDILPCTKSNQQDWRVWVAYCGEAITSPTLQVMYEHHYAQLETVLMNRLSGSKPERRLLAGIVVTAVDGIGLYATVQPTSWGPKRQRATLLALLSHHLPTRAEILTTEGQIST